MISAADRERFLQFFDRVFEVCVDIFCGGECTTQIVQISAGRCLLDSSWIRRIASLKSGEVICLCFCIILCKEGCRNIVFVHA